MGPIKLSFLWLFAAAAAYTDLRYRKVPNRLILGAAAVGAVLSACGGWTTLRSGLLGLTLGILFLLPAFILHMVGGGDVKSLAVTGLFTGPHLLWVSFLLGAVVGGLAAVVLLAARHLRRLRHGWERGTRAAAHKAGAVTLPYAAILALCAALSATW
jgi:prepilin peptidase CpaA